MSDLLSGTVTQPIQRPTTTRDSGLNFYNGGSNNYEIVDGAGAGTPVSP